MEVDQATGLTLIVILKSCSTNLNNLEGGEIKVSEKEIALFSPSTYGAYKVTSPEIKNIAANPGLPLSFKKKVIGHAVGYRKVRGPKKTTEQKAAAKEARKAMKKSIYGPLGLVSERKKFTPEQKKARRSAKGKLTRQIRADWARQHPEEATKMGFNVGRLGKSTKAKKPKTKVKGKGKKK